MRLGNRPGNQSFRKKMKGRGKGLGIGKWFDHKMNSRARPKSESRHTSRKVGLQTARIKERMTRESHRRPDRDHDATSTREHCLQSEQLEETDKRQRYRTTETHQNSTQKRSTSARAEPGWRILPSALTAAKERSPFAVASTRVTNGKLDGLPRAATAAMAETATSGRESNRSPCSHSRPRASLSNAERSR